MPGIVMLNEVLSLVGQTEGKHLYARIRDPSFQGDIASDQPLIVMN
jgi:hypothetical protein